MISWPAPCAQSDTFGSWRPRHKAHEQSARQQGQKHQDQQCQHLLSFKAFGRPVHRSSSGFIGGGDSISRQAVRQRRAGSAISMTCLDGFAYTSKHRTFASKDIPSKVGSRRGSRHQEDQVRPPPVWRSSLGMWELISFGKPLTRYVIILTDLSTTIPPNM